MWANVKTSWAFVPLKATTGHNLTVLFTSMMRDKIKCGLSSSSTVLGAREKHHHQNLRKELMERDGSN
jgi:hypothetical protein